MNGIHHIYMSYTGTITGICYSFRWVPKHKTAPETDKDGIITGLQRKGQNYSTMESSSHKRNDAWSKKSLFWLPPCLI